MVEGVVMGVALPDGAVTEIYCRLPVDLGGRNGPGSRGFFTFCWRSR